MNRKFMVTLVLVVALLMIAGSIVPTIAEARDHRHWGYHPYYPYYGWGWNPYVSPFYPSPWYIPPVVINPPPVVQERIIIQPQQPQTYIQQQPAEQQYWYLCKSAGPSGTYYPYVQSCPEGWVQVVPQTTPPSR